MYIEKHYVMRDQVKELVPEIMKTDTRGHRRSNSSFTELAFFSLAVALYVLALGLSN